jgi:CubicO group peptidase (beta-lactamase class C family)
MIQVPTPVVPVYGYMWWLNTKKQRIPSAPESVYFAAGFGGNYIVVDNEHDLVIVVRWTDDLDGIIKRILDSIK